jgi:hypothetical protein
LVCPTAARRAAARARRTTFLSAKRKRLRDRVVVREDSKLRRFAAALWEVAERANIGALVVLTS